MRIDEMLHLFNQSPLNPSEVENVLDHAKAPTLKHRAKLCQLNGEMLIFETADVQDVDEKTGQSHYAIDPPK